MKTLDLFAKRCLLFFLSATCAMVSQAATVTYPLNLSAGWNLLGNSLTTPLNVKTTFGAQASVVTVWKWDASSSTWSFYAPTLDANGTLAAYAAGKSYAVLTTINPGDGYWVNVASPISASDQTGSGFSLSAANLTSGWNLSATADNASPAVFTTAVGNVTTLWAWDNASSNWYFYAPSLAANGGLASYIAGKGYKDFGSTTLGNGLGFWVNYAGSTATPVSSPPVMADVPDQSGVVGTAIAQFKLAPFATSTDGDRITSYSVTGSLPPGLTFNVVAGAIEGIPTAPGDYTISAVARDKDGASNAKTVRFSVAAPAGPIPPIMAEVPDLHGAIGGAIAPVNLGDYATPTDGDAITGYSVLSGALPEGLKLDLTTGIISGTPTGVSPVAMLGGNYGIQIAANDKDGASNPVFVTFDVVNPMFLDAPDMGSMPPSMTIDERLAAMSKVNAQIKLIWTGTLDANQAALVSYIKTQPEFADAGIGADGTVWARFKDGRPVSWRYLSASLPAAIAQTTAQVTSQATAQKQMSAMSAATSALSGAAMRKAVLLDVDGLGRGVPLTVAGWLQNAGYGAHLTFGEVRDLMTDIRGVSVLHLDTHGFQTVNQYGKAGYYLATASHIEADAQRVLRGARDDAFMQSELGRLWDQGYIHGAIAPNGTPYWAIGQKFIRKYWTLTSDALVYVDACELFKNVWNRLNFEQALASKADKQQISVIGWNEEVYADYAAKVALQFYERALGRDDIDVPPLNTPPARPMPATVVYGWMRDTMKMVTDPTDVPHATMQLSQTAAASGILLPSITSIQVDTPNTWTSQGPDVYTITVTSGDNSFGTTPGKLVVNGKTLTPVADSWKKWEVKANVASIADLAGPVVVESQGLKSFPVPLTQWTGTISQAFAASTNNNGKVLVQCPVRATGDAHFSRNDLASTPSLFFGAWIELTAPCNYTLSGSWADSSYSYTLSGGGAVSPAPGPGYTAGYAMTHWGLVSHAGGSPVTSLPGPIDTATVGFYQLQMSGTLAKISKLTGETIVDNVTENGATHSTGQAANLGADYSISKTTACQAVNCVETWDLKPNAGTAPEWFTKS